MDSNVGPRKEIVSHSGGGGKGYVTPEEVLTIIEAFKNGVLALYNMWWPKKKYKHVKQELFKLNKTLDAYDSKYKNKLDKEIYDKLEDLKQSYFLIDDIFDKYRIKGAAQIYKKEETEDIHTALLIIRTLVNMKWYEDLLAIFGVA